MRGLGVVVLASAIAGCFLDAPPAPPTPSAVGPAPLRRLTNTEYLNALHDLFPGQSPVLPPMPADAVLGGFDNAAIAQQPSDVAVARYETIANLYAAGVASSDGSLLAFIGCDWTVAGQSTACAMKFLAETGRRVFRRPLTSDELGRLSAQFSAWQATVDFRGAAQLVLSTMLQSPQFIYRPEPVPSTASGIIPVDPYALATRMAFLLWASTPDDVLLDAAASGALMSDEGVRTQAERMLADDRARRTLWSFHRQWLGLDLVLSQTTRTATIDPAWTAQTPISAEMESELFIENTLMSGGTLHDLLLGTHAWVDGEMARVYHLPAPADPTVFSAVDLAPTERGGILTRVAFLAGTSHAGGTSPPIRGNAIQQRLLCAFPVSPPPGADLSMPTAPANSGPQTTRMLFAARTAPAACQACHASLNGIGFGFESYDAAGAYRTTEVGLPIDASGVLMGTDVDGPFDGALALSAMLDRSGLVHECMTEQWARYALAREPTETEQPLVDAWTRAFQASGGDVRALLVAIATSPTFRYRLVTP